MADFANFELDIVNNTSGDLTFHGFTNGIGSPPVSSGNPPILTPCVPALQTTGGVVNATGGNTYINDGYPEGSYPDTTGSVYFNLPDGSVLKLNWKTTSQQEATLTGDIIPLGGDTGTTSFEWFVSDKDDEGWWQVTVQPRD